MPIDLETYRLVTLEDPESNWQLICRRLKRKPERTEMHRRIIADLQTRLQTSLTRGADVYVDGLYLLAGSEHRLIPDVAVLSADILGKGGEPIGGKPAIEEPVALVVELWSPEIDGHDFDTKIWQYQARGDREIWSIHPLERTLTACLRHADGSYTEEVFRSGIVRPVALPGVNIDLDELFA